MKCFTREQFGEVPFLFQHNNAPVHKIRSIKKLFSHIDVGEKITGLSLTPFNTFGINEKDNCLFSHHDFSGAAYSSPNFSDQTYVVFLQLNIPAARGVEAVIATCSPLLMEEVLDCAGLSHCMHLYRIYGPQ